MLFNSVHFFIFAPVVIGLYFLLKGNARKWWLLLSSLYFYAVFNPPFLLILLASVVVTYFASIGIEKSKKGKKRALFLTFAILFNLSLLYFFKYIDFSFRAFNLVAGQNPCDFWYLAATGVILPLGISFFTLQAIAYAVDVYREEIPAERSLFRFTLFLSFFPQLVAGPIMRARDIMHQFGEEKRFSLENMRSGSLLIAFGIFKKTFIADRAGFYVDEIFANPEQYDWFTMWVGVFLHSLQVYGDFSGYSDIAIGTGRIMGFHIPVNFRRPFFADSVTEIWRRWHISLSSWVRDYIYIPLGGSRVAPSRAMMNLLITWVGTGIWHGADWTFIFWGLTNAVALILEKIAFSNAAIKNAFYKLPWFFRSFYAVGIFSFAIFFFRAAPTEGFSEGVMVSFTMIQRAFSFATGETLLPGISIVFMTMVLFFIEYAQEKNWKSVLKIPEHPLVYFILTGSIFTVAFILYSVTVSPQFIYFQF